MRIGRVYRLADVVGALALVAAIGAALWFGKPALMALGNYKLIVFFVLIITVILGRSIRGKKA